MSSDSQSSRTLQMNDTIKSARCASKGNLCKDGVRLKIYGKLTQMWLKTKCHNKVW